MIEKAKSIAIHSIRYGEKSLIVYLYTMERGRLTVMVNNAFGKGKQGKKAVFFQPLSLLDIVYYRGKAHGMGRLREVSSSHTLSTIHFQSIKRAIALFVGEVIYRAIREEESNPTLFAFLENSIQALDAMEEGVQNFHILFLAQLSKYLGFFPSGSYSSATPIFDIKSGFFREKQPQRPLFLSPEQSELLSIAISTAYGDSAAIHLNGNQRSQFLDSMLRYFSFHNDSIQDIRSLPILKQVFEE